ncbi:39116_t:CDS:1, partial [Gigaspora margarita]
AISNFVIGVAVPGVVILGVIILSIVVLGVIIVTRVIVIGTMAMYAGNSSLTSFLLVLLFGVVDAKSCLVSIEKFFGHYGDEVIAL